MMDLPFKWHRFLRWLRPSYHESIVFTFDPDEVMNKGWGTLTCSIDALRFQKVIGKYHKHGMFIGKGKWTADKK